MTDLGGLLSRALHAEAAQVRPSPGGLDRIRRRTDRKSRIRTLINRLTPRSKEIR